jgi:hypothetical protein
VYVCRGEALLKLFENRKEVGFQQSGLTAGDTQIFWGEINQVEQFEITLGQLGDVIFVRGGLGTH